MKSCLCRRHTQYFPATTGASSLWHSLPWHVSRCRYWFDLSNPRCRFVESLQSMEVHICDILKIWSRQLLSSTHFLSGSFLGFALTLFGSLNVSSASLSLQIARKSFSLSPLTKTEPSKQGSILPSSQNMNSVFISLSSWCLLILPHSEEQPLFLTMEISGKSAFLSQC